LNILRSKSKEGINPVRKLLFNSSDFRYLMWKLKMESLLIVDSFLEKERGVRLKELLSGLEWRKRELLLRSKILALAVI
jgi:hypothetical protein